jgi:hypothetical protein
MATYIQGQVDYISQLQPTEPNLAFDAQILQTKQAKYDANHKKVSDLYGSLLNAAMTRSDNVQARDEFFKIINDDIKRMGGLDFSLDQNVQAAASVFQSIYTNDNIVKDMVWTKNYNNEVNRMEGFKNCLDEEKCGGMYWEEGEKYMQYKRMEFKNATASQALGMGDVQFTPYKSVMKEAIKLAKEAGLSIEIDQLSPDGNYIVTTKNGMKLKSPLTALFNKTIGQNPQYAEMFKTKAYVDRNDWAYGKVSMGEYKDINEAQLGYLREVNKQNQAKLEAQADALNIDLGNLDQRTKELEEEFTNGRFVEGSEKYNELVELKELQQGAKNAKAYLDQVNAVAPSNYAGIEALTDNIDNQNAYTYFNAEIDDAAQTLAFKDYKVSMKADDFAKMKTENTYKLQQMSVQHSYDMAEEAQKQAGRIALEDHKKAIGHSSYTGEKEKDLLNKSDAYIDKKNAAANFNLDNQARANVKKIYGGEVPKASDVETWRKAVADGSASDDVKTKYKQYQKAYNQAKLDYAEAKREANKAAAAYGKTPDWNNRDVITSSDLTEYQKKYNWNYEEAFHMNTYNQLKKSYPKITPEKYEQALTKIDPSKPIVSELNNYFD